MEHSDRCSTFEACADCYEEYYSFPAVVRQLDAEAKTTSLKERLARMGYSGSDEARETKRRRFRKRFDIDAHEWKVTKGERDLRSDARLGKWRVGRGNESGLRKVWTAIWESSVELGGEEVHGDESRVMEVQGMGVVVADQIRNEAAESVKSEESGSSSGSPEN